jgi:hypothetical protein
MYLFASLTLVAVACNDNSGDENLEPGLGEVIPGMEVKQVTGTVIGRWADSGYGCLVMEVDKEYPLGEPIDYYNNLDPYYCTELSGTYSNAIQVQHKLSIAIGDRISFSVREYLERDLDLFIIGIGLVKTDHVQPSLPKYVITKYEILNN